MANIPYENFAFADFMLSVGYAEGVVVAMSQNKVSIYIKIYQ